MSNSSTRWYPYHSAAATLQINFLRRENEGSGTFQGYPGIPGLVFTFATGVNSGMPMGMIRDTILAHLINNGVSDWWKPRVGDIEGNIRAVLADYNPVWATTQYNSILFDGEFGPMYVG